MEEFCRFSLPAETLQSVATEEAFHGSRTLTKLTEDVLCHRVDWKIFLNTLHWKQISSTWNALLFNFSFQSGVNIFRRASHNPLQIFPHSSFYTTRSVALYEYIRWILELLESIALSHISTLQGTWKREPTWHVFLSEWVKEVTRRMLSFHVSLLTEKCQSRRAASVVFSGYKHQPNN